MPPPQGAWRGEGEEKGRHLYKKHLLSDSEPGLPSTGGTCGQAARGGSMALSCTPQAWLQVHYQNYHSFTLESKAASTQA